MGEDRELNLPGGWGMDVEPVRIGTTVRRQPSGAASFVHDVLRFLEEHEYGWAPKYLGMDEQGREVLEYIDGYVPHGQEVPPATWSVETMQAIFERIRKLHDLTSATELAADQECVCHGDLSYANTVYRAGRAVAFIDWDWAHAGQRIDDVAYALLQYLSIGEFQDEDPAARAQLARTLTDAYGLAADARRIAVQRMLELLLETRARQLAAARAGRPAALRLAAAGVPDLLLKRHAWLATHRQLFERALAPAQ
jgi:thiamine kinase-like enzyme